jgi:hypothetical protein
MGILCQLASRFTDNPTLSLAILCVGIVFFIWGCVSHAQGKGQSPAQGRLGFFSIRGLIILILLPDKHKNS